MPNFKIPFQEIETIPKLIKDFLNQEIPQFFRYKFSLKNALEQVDKKSKTFTSDQREVLVTALRKQLQHLDLSQKQQENLKFLLSENTFTITTGHQLNLFSGPVFFIYKILQTIKTADFLNQNSDKKFIPIFWLATEDHDFEEINHFKTEHNFYEIKGKSGGAVGRIIIEDNSFLDEFEKEFKDDVFGTQLILLAKKAYQKGRTFTDATKFLVQELFAQYGLLMIDGDDFCLKNQMKEIFSEELKNNITYQFSSKNIDFLKKKYGKVQVNPREINLFYLNNDRNRIISYGEQFQIVDRNLTFTSEDLLQDCFKISPNALLRPVYQEKILPNIAYIGGNAEIMYWLELPEVFEKFAVEFPLLIPRNSLLFLKEKTYRKIEKSKIELQDFFGYFQNVLNQKILRESALTEIIDQKEETIKKNFDELKEKATLTNKTFRNLVEAEKTRQLKSFTRMKKRLLKAEKIVHSDELEFLQNLYSEIHPSGNWQERVINFSVFFSGEGKDWIENCYKNIQVENSELIIII